MLAPPDYRQTYAGPEFQRWAHAEGLIPPERFLIEQYLDKKERTLEAGTGGGRILRAMSLRGFGCLEGFDGVPALIGEARKRDTSRAIRFDVADACDLPYESADFGQLIYLQQIVCFISEAQSRQKAIAEAHRILKPGGTALFSFLLYEARMQSALHRAMIAYLAAFRFVVRRRPTLQCMPWLSHQKKFNRTALLDRPPYVYWFRCAEAAQLLISHGFTIAGIGTLAQIRKGSLRSSVTALEREPMEGMLYVVCRKLLGSTPTGE